MTMSCTENIKNTKTHVALISGLPDHLAILCLSRVPRRYHHVLKCVSRRWKELLGSEEWHISRRKNNTEECWVYAVCKVNYAYLCYVLDPDPTDRNWKLIQCMPTPCSQKDGMYIIALGKKLYLLGGCTWQEDATDDVHCYDASSNKWAMSSRMPTARCFFASTSLNEKLYISSGFSLNSISPKTWDIYNSNSDSWISHKNPLPNHHDIVKFIAFDGKLYTIHRSLEGVHYAGIYDPASATWQITDDEIALCSCGPTVVVDGTLYMLDETLGARLMKWENARKEWVFIGRLSHHLIRPPCHLVAIGRSIYVIGQGLSTMVIDVDEAAKGKGILVGFSFSPILDIDHNVISCSTITI